MKKFVAFLLSVLMLMSYSFSVSYADEDIEVYLNGDWIYFEDQQPVIVDGRTLVPMRAVFEAMGAEVEWTGEYQRIIVEYEPDVRLTLFIGEYSIFYQYLGDDYYEYDLDLDVAPQIINGRTMVPLRAISETMGANVDWNGDSYTVSISYSIPAVDNERDYDINTFDSTSKDDYYFDTYNNIPNLGWYIDEDPFYSDSEVYKFDYSDYDEGIEDEIDTYIEDMRDEGFIRSDTRSGNGSTEYWMYGYGYEIVIEDKYTLNQVEVHINQSSSSLAHITPKPEVKATPKPTATPAPTATPKPTPEPTQAPAFKYLKDMGWHIGYKDYDMNEVSSVSGNAVQFKVYLSAKKNEWLDKGDEAGIDAEFDLDGEYSRLTGAMHGSGTKLSLRFYCDGSLEKEYTGVYSDTNLDLDVSGCQTLRIEAYGVVGSTSAIPNIKIKDAKLWYDE